MSGKQIHVPPNVSQRTKRIFQLALLEDIVESDDEVASNDSYISSDHCISSDQDSDLEICIEDLSSSEDENPQLPVTVHPTTVQPTTYYGKKNCFAWNSEAPHISAKTPERNVIKIKLTAPKGPASILIKPSPEAVWRLFFTDNILQEIVINTNKKLEQLRQNLKTPDSSSYRNTNKEEIEALLGLLILCSIFKSGREKLASLFSTDSTGRHIFRGIMSLKRCETLILALRFDDTSTRAERKENDPAAAISYIFNTCIP